MSENERSFGKIIKAPYPPMPSAKLDLKRNPLTLIPELEKEGARLGGADGWTIYFPKSQYVPEEGSGAHIMLIPDLTAAAPMSTRLVSSAAYLGILFDHLLPIVKRDSRFVFGWNEAFDIRRRTSLTWHTLHIHAVRLPEDEYLQNSPHPIKSLHEPFYNHIRSILGAHTIPVPLSKERAAFPSWEEEESFPKGGFSLYFHKQGITPAALAALTFYIAAGYEYYHGLIGQALIKNYLDVKGSHGEVLPTLRSLSEAEKHLSSLDINLPPKEKEFLLRLIKKIDMPHTDKNRLIPVPAFSFTIRQYRDLVQVNFSPQIASTRGVMEAIGIRPVRIEDPNASIEERKERAKNLAEEIISTTTS